jgi:hypothetical protein
MPKVDPMQYLMSALTTLTGGLIADMQSLILGLVVCSFIFMGLDYLMDVFGTIINDYRSNKYMKDAHAFLDARNDFDRSSAEYAYNNQIYQRLVRKSVDLKMKKWRHDDY